MARKAGRWKKVGRPPKALEERRRNRLTITLTDGELGKIHRIAEATGQPIGTVAHEIIARSLRRRK
jgi:hypothetical protein